MPFTSRQTRPQQLLQMVKTAVAERAQVIYDADDSGDDTSVSLPASHLALIDAVRRKSPAAYAVLVVGAETFRAAAAIDRRGAALATFAAVEETLFRA